MEGAVIISKDVEAVDILVNIMDIDIVNVISHSKIKIAEVFDYKLAFRYDNINNAVEFDDLCIYFDKMTGVAILAMVYPGQTNRNKILIGEFQLNISTIKLKKFIEEANKLPKEYNIEEINNYTTSVKFDEHTLFFSRKKQNLPLVLEKIEIKIQ